MPSVSFPLHPDQLKQAISAVFVERGQRYVQERRVLSADQDAARNSVTGGVRGSGGRIYQCMVQLGHQADAPLKVAGQCSCPVGYNCKHVAAVSPDAVDALSAVARMRF